MNNISPSRLKTLRKRLQMSETDLSKSAEVSRKTITNIENNPMETVPVNQKTLKRLSRALRQRPEVLSGQEDLPQERSSNETINLQLDSRTRLNYELLERRYGVTKELIFFIAPFLFAIAADESLMRQLRETVKLADKGKLDDDISVDFLYDDVEISEYIEAKYEAVENNDIMEKNMEKFYKYSHQNPNPFSEYLHEKRFENRIVNIPFDEMDFFYSTKCDMPNYLVCNEELERICLGSIEARSALTYGYVSIKDIPDHLWDLENTVERIRWLEREFKKKHGEYALQNNESSATEDSM